MNVVPFTKRGRLAEIQSFARLAHQQNRNAVSYRQWANEAALQNKPEIEAKYRDESMRRRADAVWNLEMARRIKELHFASQ